MPSRLLSIAAEQQNLFEKKLLNAVADLEELKPVVQQKLEELNRKSTYQVNKGNNHLQNNLVGFPGQYSPANKQRFKAWGTNKIKRSQK